MYVCIYLCIYLFLLNVKPPAFQTRLQRLRSVSAVALQPGCARRPRDAPLPAGRYEEPAGAGSSCWAGPGPARGRLWAGPSRAEGGRRRRRAAGMAAPGALQRSVVLPAGRHSASLIFLHGSGGCLLPSPLPPSLCGRAGARRAPLPAPRAPGHGGAEGRGGSALAARVPAELACPPRLVLRPGAEDGGSGCWQGIAAFFLLMCACPCTLP